MRLFVFIFLFLISCAHSDQDGRKSQTFNEYLSENSWEDEFTEASPLSQKSPSQEPLQTRKNKTLSPPPDLPQTEFFFDWPVDLARLTRGFNIKKKRPHLGIDLAASPGTNIYASHEGIVIYTGREFRGFGKLIIIESRSEWSSLYAHLNKILVKEGQKVRQGQLIGKMGRTGRATGVHLHFEIRKNKAAVDPLPFLPGGEQIRQKIAQQK